MRGLVIGGMVLSLLLGCNNGGELEAQKRLGEIGRSAENAFYEFIGLIADSLGFTVKADTTKDKVGQHFTDLGKQLGIASDKLEEITKKATVDDDKDGILGKAIKEAVDAAKATLSALKGHLESLKDIGDGTVVGDATATKTQGVAANDGELKKVYQALTGIVGIAEKEGVEKPEVGNITLNNGTDNSTGAKILATTNSPAANDVGKAAAILESVIGKQMLASIVASQENDATTGVSGNANGNTSALAFAKGGTDSDLAQQQAKAAAVAGGIALRSLVKKGTLSSGASAGIGTQGGKEEVQGVGITAVNKLLGAVEDIIKKTVKNVIGKAKTKIDEARASKTVGQK